MASRSVKPGPLERTSSCCIWWKSSFSFDPMSGGCRRRVQSDPRISSAVSGRWLYGAAASSGMGATYDRSSRKSRWARSFVPSLSAPSEVSELDELRRRTAELEQELATARRTSPVVMQPTPKAKSPALFANNLGNENLTKEQWAHLHMLAGTPPLG